MLKGKKDTTAAEGGKHHIVQMSDLISRQISDCHDRTALVSRELGCVADRVANLEHKYDAILLRLGLLEAKTQGR